MKRMLIVGIGGVTCGGKSTLAKMLQSVLIDANLKTTCLHQDEFYITENDMLFLPHLNYHHWDQPSAVDFKRLRKSVSDMRQSDDCNVIIIEGNMILADDGLNSDLDQKFFFTGEYSNIVQRRKARVYDPPDVEGYFDQIVWPAYLAHAKSILSRQQSDSKLAILNAENCDKNFLDIFCKVSKTLLTDLLILSRKPLNSSLFRQFVRESNSGAVVEFEGIIRKYDSDKIITGLYYECYEAMARKVLQRICERVRLTIPDIDRIAVGHFIGHAEPSQTTFIVAVSSTHRQPAFSACQRLVDDIKSEVPIWKKEIYGDGTFVWKDGNPNSCL